MLPSRRDTTRLGARIAASLRAGDLVVLGGALGAGKTFLARAIVRSMGVGRDEVVPSPTFALVHEYRTPRGEVLHADLYRLIGGETPLDEEVGRLGLRERRAEGAILLAEWAEVAEGALGGKAELAVSLAILGENVRRATMRGARAAEL
jgi:tRNA threonylcarbamoyladenosine biosynthesis protein TsaE